MFFEWEYVFFIFVFLLHIFQFLFLLNNLSWFFFCLLVSWPSFFDWITSMFFFFGFFDKVVLIMLFVSSDFEWKFFVSFKNRLNEMQSWIFLVLVWVFRLKQPEKTNEMLIYHIFFPCFFVCWMMIFLLPNLFEQISINLQTFQEFHWKNWKNILFFFEMRLRQ